MAVHDAWSRESHDAVDIFLSTYVRTVRWEPQPILEFPKVVLAPISLAPQSIKEARDFASELRLRMAAASNHFSFEVYITHWVAPLQLPERVRCAARIMRPTYLPMNARMGATTSIWLTIYGWMVMLKDRRLPNSVFLLLTGASRKLMAIFHFDWTNHFPCRSCRPAPRPSTAWIWRPTPKTCVLTVVSPFTSSSQAVY